MNLIKRSPFSNTYGSLILVQDVDGKYYLHMQDCIADDLFGPLTQEQIDAFHVLCDVPESDK